MDPRVKVIILAGGEGMRLWPYSTERLPKQFLSIHGQPSSFSQAVIRAQAVTGKENIFISSNKKNVLHIKRELRSSGISFDRVLVKESDYDTGLSVFHALEEMKSRFGMGDEDVVVVLPSDHVIGPIGAFSTTIGTAVRVAAEHHMVALGKRPLGPQESYGYISLEKQEKGELFMHVKRFTEKPSREVAERLIAEGPCLWNLGIYIFSAGHILSELHRQFGVASFMDLEKNIQVFAPAVSMSFDTMIAEKAKDLVAIEAEFDWLDIGSWRAFRDLSQKDAEENANLHDHILLGTRHSLVMGRGKPVVAVNIDGLLVIDHKDALLLVPEGHVDVLKKAMPLIKERYPRLTKGLPYVSVCTPIFGDEQGIEETVKSVARQTYPFIEQVIMNFGPKSSTAALQKRINAIKGEKVVDVIAASGSRQALYAAINKALHESTGEIIAILNAGDTYADEGVIEAIVDAMEKEGADVCWGDLAYVKESGSRHMVRFWQSSPYARGLFRAGWMPPHPSFFVRRWVYEQYGGFRTDLSASGGYELMLRVLEKEKVKGVYVPRIMVKAREGNRIGLGRLFRIIQGNLQSYRAWKLNGLRVRPGFIFQKPFTKLKQLFARSRPVDLE